MSQCDQALSVFLSAFEKINYVTWILKIDFECLGKEIFILSAFLQKSLYVI
jgi:hypothetical protein